MKQLDNYFWGDAQGEFQPCFRRVSDVDERGLSVHRGAGAAAFEQHWRASRLLHLLLYLGIRDSVPESVVPYCIRVATHSGCYNQHFTSCCKFSFALYNATFHQALRCFKKLRPCEKLTWENSICCWFYSSEQCKVFCLSVAGMASQSLFWARRISVEAKFSACILTLKLNPWIMHDPQYCLSKLR